MGNDRIHKLSGEQDTGDEEVQKNEHENGRERALGCAESLSVLKVVLTKDEKA